MSKLLNKYNELKKEDSSFIYIFRVGIFYNIFNNDADILSNALGLKITHLSDELYKVGFPISQIEKYSQLLTNKNIKFKVVDNLDKKQTNEYLKNIELKKIVNQILNIDINNTTFSQAFNLLIDIQKKLEQAKEDYIRK